MKQPDRILPGTTLDDQPGIRRRAKRSRSRDLLPGYYVYCFTVLCMMCFTSQACFSSPGSGSGSGSGSETHAGSGAFQDTAKRQFNSSQKQGFKHRQTENTDMKASTIDQQLIPFRDANGRWGYLDRQTLQVKIAPIYFWANLFHNGVAQVSLPNPQGKTTHQNKLTGWIDPTGKAIFEPQFTEVFDVRAFINKEKLDGLKMVTLGDGKYGIIDLDLGKYLVPPGKFKDFFFYDRSHFRADKKVFYADGVYYKAPKGCEITVVDQQNRLFYIRKGNDFRKGIATWDGKIIVPPKYMEVSYIPQFKRYLTSRFDQPVSKLTLKALLGGGHINGRIIAELLDQDGNILGSFRSDYTADTQLDDQGNYSLGVYSRNGSEFYFSLATGQAAEAPSQTRDNYKGYKIVKTGMKWGLTDPKGKFVYEPSYTKLSFLDNDLVYATRITDQNTDVHGVLDIHGHIVIPIQYSDLEYIKTSYGPGPHFRVSKGGKNGIFDLKGHLIVPIIYDNAVYFRGPRSEVYKDHHSGVIDSHGQVIIPVIYKTVFSSRLQERIESNRNSSMKQQEQEQGKDENEDENENENETTGLKSATRSNKFSVPEYYRVENKSGRWGLLDSAGKTVIGFDYGYVSTDPAALAAGWVSIEDTTRKYSGKYNIQTGVIIPPVYNIIRLFDQYNCMVVAKRRGNDYIYQLLDLKGKALSDTGYTFMDFRDAAQYFICRKEKKYGVLDTKGQQVVPLQYDYLWSEQGDLLMAQLKDAYFMIDLSGKQYRLDH